MKTNNRWVKKLLSMLLVLVMVVGMLPMTAYAIVDGDGWYISDDGILFVTGKLTALPAYSYQSINVISSGELAFSASDVWKYEVTNAGTISGGTFRGKVTNIGTISDGTYQGEVTNTGTISGGTFHGTVTNRKGTIVGGAFRGAVVNTQTISGGTFRGNVENAYGGIISGGTFILPVTNNNVISGGTFQSLVTNNYYISNGTFHNTVSNSSGGEIDGGTFTFAVHNEGVINKATFQEASIIGSDPIAVIHSVNGEDKPLRYGNALLDELGEPADGTAWYANDAFVSGGTVPLTYTVYTATAHSHRYAYTGSGNTVTETCTNGCGHNETASLHVDAAYVYTGAAMTPATIVYSAGWRGETPSAAVSYGDNINVGTATASVEIEGNTITASFAITAKDISAAAVTVNPTGGTYNGTAYEPSVSVTVNGATLVEDTDYTLSWDKSGFTNVDSYTVTVTGTGNFTGTKTATFSIDPVELDETNTVVTLDQDVFVYNGTAHKPTVTVTFNGATLREGVDYEVLYLRALMITQGKPTRWFGYGDTSVDCINVGDRYYAVVMGIGNYYTADNLTLCANFVIEKATVTEPTIVGKPYNGSVQTADITDTERYTVEHNNGGENAGNYDVVLKLKDSANYKWATTDDAEVTLLFTIIQARNTWITAPSITGWTYGETANAPTGEARFGTIEVLYSGTANDGTAHDSYIPPTKAGTYVAMFSVNGTANYEPIGEHVVFTIQKARYDMTGAKWNYREPFMYDGKAHTVEVVGLPAGVTVERYENNTATAVSDYYAKATLAYDVNNYYAPTIPVLGWTIYNDWTPAEYTVNGSGWMNEDFAITANDGYRISLTNTADGTWSESLTDSAETDNGSVTFYLKNETNGTISLAKTVSYKLDKTAPTGKVEFVERTGWEVFVNAITFGLFYKDEVTVKATATDTLSGVATIEYASADEAMHLDEVKAITDWTEYNGEFGVTLEDKKKFVYFVRITDKAGNVTYLSTDGAEYDTTAPVLYGIENGGVYHGDKIFKATDDNFLKIEVDGVDITDTTEGDDEFTIVADNAAHTVTVTDKAGNVTAYTITVYKRYRVTFTDGDGGSYEKDVKYGDVITIPQNEFFEDTFRKTGYTLTEWQGYTEGMTMPLEDVTFTAVYTPNRYTVSFDANGGEAIDPISVVFDETYGNALPSSAVVGLSGGNKNWYLTDAHGNVTDTNVKKLTTVSTARDHTLFIKRTVLAPTVSIALTVPGGISDGYLYYIPGASQRVLTATVGNMNTDILEYTYQWYRDATPIDGATAPVLTLDGNVSDSGTYKVEVTATLKDGTHIVVTSDTASGSKEQKVKILHATNTLSYDANGGEGGPQSAYTGGTSLSVSDSAPTREHYTFVGWNTKSDGTGDGYAARDGYTFADDNGNGGCVVTLYAQWKPVTYTVTYTADGEPVSTETVEHGKDATLPAVPTKDGYVGKWDSDGKNIIGDTTISAVYTAIPVVKPDEVKPEDKDGLEDMKTWLEEERKDGAYAEDDQKAIQDAIDAIESALAVLGNVDAVETLIGNLPNPIRKEDGAAVKAADDAYRALTDYERSLVDAEAKKALDDAKAALAALNTPSEPLTSPVTGDNGSLWLWFVLLFVSGAGVFGITLYDRKRNAANQ